MAIKKTEAKAIMLKEVLSFLKQAPIATIFGELPAPRSLSSLKKLEAARDELIVMLEKKRLQACK